MHCDLQTQVGIGQCDFTVSYNHLDCNCKYLQTNGLFTRNVFASVIQGGHGTGKTGNLVLTFSRQGKHREFCFDTGKNFETQGKYFL